MNVYATHANVCALTLHSAKSRVVRVHVRVPVLQLWNESDLLSRLHTSLQQGDRKRKPYMKSIMLNSPNP